MEKANYFIPNIIKNFEDLLERKKRKDVLNSIQDYHPSEIASFIQTLNEKYRKQFIQILSTNFDPKILVELEPSFLEKIINEFDVNFISKAIKELDSDDAASIINILDSKKKNEVLSKVSSSNRILIEDNLSYKENTAGRLMQSEVVKVPLNFNVGQVVKYLRKTKSLPKVFYDLFIVDQNNVLVGNIPLSRIVSTSENVKISTIMETNHYSIHFSLDQGRGCRYF